MKKKAAAKKWVRPAPKFVLIPYIDAADFPNDVTDECVDAEVPTHYSSGIMRIDWSDPDDMPRTQAWLVETFGEQVREHQRFAVQGT